MSSNNKGLYKKGDGVVILSDANFQDTVNKKVLLANDTFQPDDKKVKMTSGCRGAGVLKAYATWCPHCIDKVQDFKDLAADFKLAKDLNLIVYTIEADINKKFAQDANIEGFPTILYVSNTGEISPLLTASGSAVSNVLETIGALCETKKKCLKRK